MSELLKFDEVMTVILVFVLSLAWSNVTPYFPILHIDVSDTCKLRNLMSEVDLAIGGICVLQIKFHKKKIQVNFEPYIFLGVNPFAHYLFKLSYFSLFEY